MGNVDFKVTGNGFLVFDKGDIVFITGVDQVMQHIAQRLKTFLGEWEYNIGVGIPYYDLLEKPVDYELLSYWLRKTILETPYVSELEEFSFELDKTHRKLFVKFKCKGQLEGVSMEVVL